MEQIVSPYMLLAGATVAKLAGRKAVDALARSSLHGISNALNHRFRGNSEVQHLKAELELKTKVLLLPVDACVKQAQHGNTVLQGAVDVALEALRQIGAFEEAVQAQELSSARGERSGSSDAMSATQTCAKLRKLIDQLDTLVPYLTVAIASSGLTAGIGGMSPGHDMLSPARLLFASGALAAAAGCTSACVFEIQRAQLYKEVSSRTQSGMKVLFPLCSVRVMATSTANVAASVSSAVPGTPAAANDGAKHPPSSAKAAAGSSVRSGGGEGDSAAGSVPRYTLHLQQSLDDGLYHEEGEAPGALTLLVSNMTGISWTTANSLGLDTDPFSPALAMQIPPEQAADTTAAAATPTLSRGGSAAGTAAPPQLYAIQCVMQAVADDEASDQGSVNLDAPPVASDALIGCAEPRGAGSDAGSDVDSDGAEYKSAAALSDGAAADVTRSADDDSPQRALGRLNYVLRLCCLEMREGVPHTAILEDDRLRVALSETDLVLQGEASSPMAAGSMKRTGSLASATPAVRSQMSAGTPGVDSVTRNLTKLGFGGAI